MSALRAALRAARDLTRAHVVVATAIAAVVVLVLGGVVVMLSRGSSAPQAGSTGSPTVSPTASATPTPDPTESTGPAVTPTSPSQTPLAPHVATAASGFYVDPTMQATVRAASPDPADAPLLLKIASTPQALWLGDWFPTATVKAAAQQYAAPAAATGKIPFLVLYAIPGRDCGQHSAGGLTAAEYPAWVAQVAAGLQGTGAWVILEPDSLAQLGSCAGQGDRVGMLKQAAASLDAAGVRVYLDGGHSGWRPPSDMATRLNKVGFAHAAGFALNVSNYTSSDAERVYGEKVATAVGGSVHFVIDTSRNGRGGIAGQWCNVRGQALGTPSQLVSDGSKLDAYLWIKRPGQSDGTCGGGPAAGQWWLQVALELARNSGG